VRAQHSTTEIARIVGRHPSTISREIKRGRGAKGYRVEQACRKANHSRNAKAITPNHGLTEAQLFQWRKAYLEGSLVVVGANETVVSASELQEAMRRIKQLEGALGLKTLENKILKESVDFAKAKSGMRARLHCPEQWHGGELRQDVRARLCQAGAEARFTDGDGAVEGLVR